MQVVVYTHDRAHWCLPGFAYLFNTYWSALQPVLVAGGVPSVTLPANFNWVMVPSRIKERWSDGAIELLNMIDQDYVTFLLEDYFLVRYVDWEAIGSLEEYMTFHPEVMKIDLTNDRLHSGQAYDVGYWGHCDLIETPWDCPYQLSLQGAIWSRRGMLEALQPAMSPWDFELQNQQDSRFAKWRILGTRNAPMRYLNCQGMSLNPELRYRTEHIRDGVGGRTIERIDDEHLKEMLRRGILPPQRE